MSVVLVAIAIGLVVVTVFGGYLLLLSRVDAYKEDRRLRQVWGRETDRPPPWEQPTVFDDSGPQWRKAQFSVLMDRLPLVKTNDHEDYLFRQDYLRDRETGQLWRLTTEEPNMSQFLRLTPVDKIPDDN